LKVDLMHVLYTVSLFIFAFIAAVFLTKMLSKYTNIFEEKEEE